jgi:hypothetical protein
VGELQSALDALGAEDLDDLVTPQYLDRTRMLLRARNRIDAELARTARRAELTQAPEYDGKKSMASWLRGHCRLSAGKPPGWCATAAHWSTFPPSPQPAPTVS